MQNIVEKETKSSSYADNVTETSNIINADVSVTCVFLLLVLGENLRETKEKAKERKRKF